jgi:hypothetical protein
MPNNQSRSCRNDLAATLPRAPLYCTGIVLKPLMPMKFSASTDTY